MPAAGFRIEIFDAAGRAGFYERLGLEPAATPLE